MTSKLRSKRKAGKASKADGDDSAVPEGFAELIGALVVSITSPRVALHTLRVYAIGLNMLVLRTKAGYPYAELNEILDTLLNAIGDIVRHGDDGGARHAKRLIQDVLKAAERYVKQRKATRREHVISAIRTPIHALMRDRRSKYFPNYEGIAEAILWSHLSREDFVQRKTERREDFIQPVSTLAERLSQELSEYYADGYLRPEVDPDDVARRAFKVAGIPPHNVLDAAQRMKASRARRRS